MARFGRAARWGTQMKTNVIVGSALLLTVGLASVLPGDEAREVEAAMGSHHEALRSRDVAALARVLSDDYVSTQTEGIVLDKAQELEKARTSDSRYEAFGFDEVRVRIYGQTAVVTSRLTYRGIFRGGTFAGRNRRTSVWVRSPQGWRLVAQHNTRIPSSP